MKHLKKNNKSLKNKLMIGIKKQNLFRALIFCLIGLTVLYSCKSDKKEIDISTISIDIPTNTFHKYLLNTSEFTQENLEAELSKNENFVQEYTQNVLGEQPAESVPVFKQFKEYFDSIGILTLIADKFQSLPEEQEYKKMQKRLVALFPSHQPVPLTTMVSGFNFKNMLLDDQLGIGLELYLGDDFDYTKLGTVINDYQLHRFNREYIVPDASTAIINDFFPDQGEFNTFLKRIIYEGKKMYLKSKILPDVSPSILMGLKEEDYEWCEYNEQMIWQYFVSEELLFSHDIQRWKTYTFDGPFSAGMPEEAPAQTGNFIGYKIITSYMDNNPDVSMRELLENQDANGIFKAARYAP